MAIDQVMNEEESGREEVSRTRSGSGKVMLILFSAILLVGTSVGATLFLTGILGGGASEGAPDAVASGADAQKKPPIYMELGDPFVVNYIEGNQIRYLQVRLEAMTRDPAAGAAITRHLPRIRNNLVLMLSGFEYAALGTVEGKEKVRELALAEVQGVLRQETGSAGVEAIYFTSFVMQ